MPPNDPPSVRALTGLRIGLMHSDGRDGPMVEALRQAGATLTTFSPSRIEPLNAAPLLEAVMHVAQYGWVLLTSAHAVQQLANALESAQCQLGACKVAVVGAAAQDAVSAMGWRVSLIPDRASTDGLVDAMATRSDIEGVAMLYPAADAPSDRLPSALRALGAIVDVIPVYRSVPDLEARERLRALVVARALDLVVMPSTSTVDALLEAIPPELAVRIPVACIGPVASRAARRAGFPVMVEADGPSALALVRRIGAAFRVP